MSSGIIWVALLKASYSIRCNCQKIYSWIRRHETIQEIRKKATFLKVINSHRKETYRVVAFNSRHLPNSLNTGTTGTAITSLFECHFKCGRFILLVQIKQGFLWAMAAVKVVENHGDEEFLAWYLQWRVYTQIATWTHSSNGVTGAAATAAAKAPKLKASHGKSQKCSQRLF